MNMTKHSEDILGWQLREPAGRVQSLWDVERRERYLLAPNIRLPLSVDKRVWPLADLPEVASFIFEDFTDVPNEAPNGLDVFQLRKDMPQSLWAPGDYQIVGIGMQHDIAEGFREKNFIMRPTVVKIPLVVKCLLGFDVCDRWLLSGLMNCGFEAADQKRLREAYAGSLNAYGLFDQVETAAAFAVEINQFVPEHAPFVPASLFTLEKPAC